MLGIRANLSRNSNGNYLQISVITFLGVEIPVMPQTSMGMRRRLEEWSPGLFMLAAVMFLLSAAVTVVDIAVGAEQFRLEWGQLTVGLGWLAGLVGLLGLYRILAQWNRWVVRGAALFVGVGLIGYAIMTAGLIAIVAGVPEATLEPLEPLFLPLMLFGSVLTFPLFGIGCVRSDRISSATGVLLIAQTAAFLVNALTPTPAMFVLVVVLVLMLINVGISRLRRADARLADQRAMTTRGKSTGG